MDVIVRVFYRDFIFIDGGHLGEVPYLDMINTKDRLKIGGLYLIDDMDPWLTVPQAAERIDWSDFEELDIGKQEKKVKLMRRVR